MSRVTQQQVRFLEELRDLDDIHLGCLAVSAEWSRVRADWVEQQCVERGWVRLEFHETAWGRVMYLTTRGLRVLQREERRRSHQRALALGEAS